MNFTVVHDSTGLGGVLGGTVSTVIADSDIIFVKGGIYYALGGGNYAFIPFARIVSITAPGAFNAMFA